MQLSSKPKVDDTTEDDDRKATGCTFFSLNKKHIHSAHECILLSIYIHICVMCVSSCAGGSHYQTTCAQLNSCWF